MKNKKEHIEEMAKNVKSFITECFGEHCQCCGIVEKCYPYYFSKVAYHFGYRKASDVIDEFVKRINLIECEMFHKAHDVRNSCEYEIDHGNTDDKVWGDKRACDGKMVALQDFMTKIEKLAAEMRQEMKNV